MPVAPPLHRHRLWRQPGRRRAGACAGAHGGAAALLPVLLSRRAEIRQRSPHRQRLGCRGACAHRSAHSPAAPYALSPALTPAAPLRLSRRSVSSMRCGPPGLPGCPRSECSLMPRSAPRFLCPASILERLQTLPPRPPACGALQNCSRAESPQWRATCMP